MHVHHNTYGHRVHGGGRHRPLVTAASHPHLFKSARKYLKGSLPSAPTSFDYFAASRAAQADILGNDELGDCTAAGACHAIESVTAAAGSPVVLTREDAVRFYSLATGYNPADPSTDQGGDEVTVCTTWRDKGLDGKGAHAISGWLACDDATLANPKLVKTLAWLFEIAYFGLELDKAWPDISGDGFVWDEGTPDPEEGHCVEGGAGDDEGLGINSWGFIGKITYRAIAKFCSAAAGGNLFFILTPEVIDRAKGKAPSGFDFATLLADLAAEGGNVTPPPAPDVLVDTEPPPVMPAEVTTAPSSPAAKAPKSKR